MLRYGPDAAPVDPGIEHHGVAQFVRALRGTSQQLEVDMADDLGVLLLEPMKQAVADDQTTVAIRAGLVSLVLQKLLE
jgi:hypothetical protein